MKIKINSSPSRRSDISAPMMKMILVFNMIAGAAEPPDPEDVVVVTATRTPGRLADAPVATEVIDRAAIEASGAVTLDQLLEMVPGVQLVEGYRGPGLSLRGHDPAHTLVLVDGRRAIGRVGGSLDLRRFSTSNIERIEIVRGPTSALYGADALGGVVQIITRRPKQAWSLDAQGTGGGYAGIYGTSPVALGVDGVGGGLDQAGAALSVGLVRGPVRALGSVNVTALDAWDRSLEDAATTGDALRMVAPSLGFGVQTGVGELRLDVDGLLQDGRGIDGSATGAVLDRLHRTSSWSAGLGGRFQPDRGPAWTVNVEGSLYRDQLRQDQRLSDALDTLEVTQEALGRLVVQVDDTLGVEARHQVVGGAEVQVEDVSAERIVDGHADRQRGALFVQEQWRVHDATGLVLLAGVRCDLDSRFGAFPAPRIALRMEPHPAVLLRVAGGLGFRAPDFKQLFLDFANPSAGYRVSGNPDLRPERSLGGTLDLELRPNPAVEVALSGWHDSVRDLITTDLIDPGAGSSPAAYGYVNVGKARVQGATISLSLGRPAGGQARLSYTLTDADDLDKQRPLPGRAEHQINARLTGALSRWGLGGSLGFAVLGPRPLYPSETEVVILPWTPLLDARVSWRVTPEVELFAGVDNALDVGRNALDPSRPRRVYGGLNLHLSPKGEP